MTATRLPVVTRQLAERRARLAAEVPRLERLLKDVSDRLTHARAELAAVDLILPTFDARVDPTKIAPIAGRTGCYGKRGVFKDELLKVLAEAEAVAVSTAELSLTLRQRFALDFASAEAALRWSNNVLRAQLRRLVGEGIVERIKLTDGGKDDAYWRLVAAGRGGTLDDLRKEAGMSRAA